MECYNPQRSHQGYCLYGRARAHALRDTLGRDDLPAFVPPAISTGEQVIDSAA